MLNLQSIDAGLNSKTSFEPFNLEGYMGGFFKDPDEEMKKIEEEKVK